MSMKLRELIRAVRACKTAAEERAVITKELALIRNSFKEEEAIYRPRNVAKLIYISMLGGHATHFGQLETLKLIASPRFSDKRIGYLGMALLIEEHADVLTLVTNSLSQDLNHSSPYVASLALTALANVGSAEMLRDLSTLLHKTLESADSYVKKKALICCIELFKHEPDLAADFLPRISGLLNDNNHAVQLTAMTCLYSIAQALTPEERKPIRKLVPTLVKILKKLVGSGFAPEYDVAGHNDPHLQVTCLKLLRVLGEKHEQASEHMSDILAQVATNTDSSKNAGNAILNEVVRTIMGIEAEPGLHVLAVNILGRFLSNKDTNIKYVALATLERLVHIDKAAVQRHRATIVACLKDPDVSIRNRALDNVFHLMESNNVEELVREVVAYLGVAPQEQRGELSSRIADVVDKFPVSRKWQIETLLDVLTVAGNQAPRHVWRHAVSMIGQDDASPLRSHVAHRLYSVISRPSSDVQLGLAQTALWVLGEFGEFVLRDPPASCAEAGFDCEAHSVEDVLATMERLLRAHDADNEVRAMVLVTLLKLSQRFRDRLDETNASNLEELLGMYRTSMNVELQARSFEFLNIYAEPQSKKAEILKRMQVPDEKNLRRLKDMRAGGARAADQESVEHSRGAALETNLLGDDTPTPSESSTAAPAAAKSLIDLDDLFGAGAAKAPVPEPSPGTSAPAASSNLLDLFAGGGVPAPAPAPSASPIDDLFGGSLTATAPIATPPAQPSAVIFNEGPVRIVMTLNSTLSAPGSVQATAEFYNQGGEPLNDVVMQVAVPKYMTVKLSPASGSALGLGSGPQIAQAMEFTNSLSDKPYMMKLKVSYASPSHGAVVAQAVVNEFPR